MLSLILYIHYDYKIIINFSMRGLVCKKKYHKNMKKSKINFLKKSS